ncbi:16S rRNA (guanine527-N7)-methyltransferase [Nocardioides thalensis]|uniref:Ribosomal RNA small subunit methyltransferase G n=1 Tax=Nocardioides thalensis TaxID=1914755 RepID=A0A853CAZ0_9ACTN|nr:16S rRNA (guanine527-N7)-methyltransferase [Nocardioides thalensis]
MKPGPDDSAPPPGPGAPPRVAERLFPGDRLEVASAYAGLLATDGVVRGLIGPREAPRLWGRHLVNCALMSAALPDGARVADIGSGAGLPGLVLAIARPDISMTLAEPLLRRTTFLQEAVEELGLENVTVRRDRADALHGVETFDVVTARAVAPLERLLGWCMPLVSPTGELVAMKGTSVEEEVAGAATVLSRLGCGEPVIEVYGEQLAEEDASVEPIRVVRVGWRDRVRGPAAARVELPTSGAAGRRPGTGSHNRRRGTDRSRQQSRRRGDKA